MSEPTPEQIIGEFMATLNSVTAEVLLRAGRLPEDKYDIPADVSLRVSRAYRRTLALLEGRFQ